eukprot:14424268-Heterocapsa_arctica.AAC.1
MQEVDYEDCFQQKPIALDPLGHRNDKRKVRQRAGTYSQEEDKVDTDIHFQQKLFVLDSLWHRNKRKAKQISGTYSQYDDKVKRFRADLEETEA